MGGSVETTDEGIVYVVLVPSTRGATISEAEIHEVV
jgi:hypothetical protein